MESDHKRKSINVVELVAEYVAEWRTFGRVLGLRESFLEKLQANYQFSDQQRNFEVMKRFSHPFDPKQSWTFWREYLQQFDNGIIVVKDIEMEHIELLAAASNDIEHIVAIENNIYIGHPYENNSTNLLAESDMNNAIISVRLSDEKNGFTDYQEYEDWVLTQKHYIDTYNMLQKEKTINFIDEYCPILETLNDHFTKTKDPGLVVKGYNFVNEFCLFKKGVFPKHYFGDTYFSYFAHENIVLYITKCTYGTSHAFYHSMQNIQIANTIHKELRKQNITQVNVIIHNNNSSNDVFCKQCIDNDLFVKEDIFTDIEKFLSWYSKVLEKITNIRLKVEQPEKENESPAAEKDEKQTFRYKLKRMTTSEAKIQKAKIIKKNKIKLNRKEICESFKKHIIAYEALERNVLPSFSNLPEDQMEELKKLIVLSPNQIQALHSNHNHILLRGSYGSGKSLLLFKKFEQIIHNMSDLDIVYLICNDQQSQFTHYMKYVLSKYSTRNVVVCNSKEITSDTDVVPKLSYILNHIKNVWKDRTVHILIDEFNGSYFNENEIKKLKSTLIKFQNSHIVIALQSMEHIIEETDNDVGYKFDLLTTTTPFKCYNLDYSLRGSHEISEFVKATAEVIEPSKVTSDKVKIFAGIGTLVDSEQGMEYLNESLNSNEVSVVGTYKYNQNEEIGHTVSAGMVNIYHSSSKKLNGENDRYFVYLSTLVYILKDLSEVKKYVICTYDRKIYDAVYFYLEKKGCYNWTDKITEFTNSKSTFTLLLTDYAAVRGYEFSNFIFLSPLGNKFLKYRMLECFARSTTELHIISDDINVTKESIDHQIIKKWKKLKCVNFNYCSYNKSADEVYLSNRGNKILYRKENASKLYTDESQSRYPWNYVSRKINELEEEQLHDDISIGLRCVFSMDNIRLFNDFINLHNIDIYTYRDIYDYNLLAIASKYDAVCVSQILINDYMIDANFTDKYKSTPLHLAALYGSSNMVDLLLKSGANVHVNDENDENALHISSEKGHIKIVQLILDNRTYVNLKNKHGSTPLHNSAYGGYIEIVQLLLHNEADVNLKNHYGETALHQALREGYINIAQVLLDNGADVNVKNKSFETALHQSSLKGHINIVQLLMDNGADVNVKNMDGETPLHLSLDKGHLNIVQLLLNNGADVNVKNKDSETPLHNFLCRRNINIVQLLLDNAADANIKNMDGETALHLSSRNGYINIVQLLLDNGADVNFKNIFGETALHLSSCEGHTNTVQLLLDNGADVNVKNIYGETALHLSSSNGYINIVQLLLDKGADVNVKGGSDETALHLSSSNGYINIVQLILDKGADVNVKNLCDETALHLSSCEGHTNTVQLLLDNGADVNAKNKCSETPLHQSSVKGHINIVQLLLDNGADVNVKNINDETALRICKRNTNIIKILLDNGADVNAENKYFNTTIDLA